MAILMSQNEAIPLADAASSWPGPPSGGEGPNWSKLTRRIWFTIGALLVYRLGTYIPIPGIDPAILVEPFWVTHFAPVPDVRDLLWSGATGVFGIFDMFAGGALGRMSIFALSIIPYISAAIFVRLLTAFSPRLKTIENQGEEGRKKIYQYTRYATVLLCLVQSYGIALGLERAGGGVLDPGLEFRVSTALTLTAGTVFLMWLAEQITRRGVGNGMALIIFTGIVANLPWAIVATSEMGRQGSLPIWLILTLLVMVIIVVAIVVVMERAQRRVIVQYPKRQVGTKMFGGEASHLPLKLNTAGVIPPIFASSLLLMPLMVPGISRGGGPEWLTWVTATLGRGQLLYLSIYIGLIVVFAFFYARIVFRPVDTAENLERHGGFIPGVRQGRDTAEYLNQVLTRLTTLGAAYLALICLLPEILISKYAVPFYFGGTSLLIVVVVLMDTVGQIHSHLLTSQYEGQIKKAKLKNRRKDPQDGDGEEP